MITYKKIGMHLFQKLICCNLQLTFKQTQLIDEKNQQYEKSKLGVDRFSRSSQ